MLRTLAKSMASSPPSATRSSSCMRIWALGPLTRPNSAYKRAFSPDKALAIATRALASVNTNNHFGDTIVGSLHLVRAEALLCMARESMRGSVRDEYEAARHEAKMIFDRLGMNRKLRRLDFLERRLGLSERAIGTP
jgi:hypothetical protein